MLVEKEFERLQKEMKKQVGKLEDELEAAYEEGKGAISTIEENVAKNPWKSLLIAFGVGLLASRWLERKSNDIKHS